MTKDEIRAIIRETLREVEKQQRDKAYAEIRARLKLYFEIGDDPQLEEAMNKFSADAYFCVIKLSFDDLYTNEQIAEMIKRDLRTVTRNKRRICMQIYNELKR